MKRIKLPCPDIEESDSLTHFVTGSYCPRCASFDEASYRENWHIPFFLVFSFLRRYARRDLRVTRDPVLSMVCAEIWLYNIAQSLMRDGNIDSEALKDPAVRERILPKCNTHSIALSLDLSPETVRRKVKRLIEMGWVTKAENGQLNVSAESEAIFAAEFNVETMRDFVSTARTLFALLGMGLAPVESSGSSAPRLPAPKSKARGAPRKGSAKH